MLQLNQISLLQFKNYPQVSFTFTERIIGICGRNGMGKTNLLDAIHYLSFTKSYFGKNDAQHVFNGAQGFRVAGQMELNKDSREVVCILRETGRKEFFFDGEQYEKFAHHIGKFPSVFIAPDDVQIITDGSEERRRFLDTLLCQMDPQYLQHLMDYNKTLQQRNSCLKAWSERKVVDGNLLEVYDRQLIDHGNYIFEQRKKFLEKLIPVVKDFYRKIAGNDESIQLSYESPLLQTSFDALLKQYREKDMMLQRTTQGVHRDDVVISLQEFPFKSIASQGQRKSLLFALKLAEFEILKESKGFPPILLLDDVFEKLDEQRMNNLLNWVCIQNKGQIFITDTHRERLEMALTKLHEPFQMVELKM